MASPNLGTLFSALSVLIVSVWTISIVNGTRLDALDAQRVLARHLDEETRILPTEVADDLVLGDFGALEQTLNQKLTRTELAAVRYRDAAGTRLDLQEADEGNHGVPYWFIRLTGLQPISGQANAIIGGRHYGTFTITLTPIEEVTRLWQRLLERIRTLGMTLTVLMLGIWLVLRSSLKPLAQFDVALQQLAKGNLDTRLKPAGSPELRRAMKTFNFMTQSLASARQALLAESERTRVTLASIGDGVIAIDAQGRVEYMNPMAESLTGWQLNEVIGLQGEEVFHLIDENTRAAIDWPLLQVLQEKRPLRLASNTLLITRFGKSFPVEDSAAPIFDRDGHSVIGAVLVFHDQSDTRAQLNRLREREAQLSAVINTSPIGILVISPLGDIQRANRAACQALGWEESELPSIFALTHPDDLPASLQHYSALGNNQASTVTLEKRYQRRNRDYFWSETVLTPLTDDNGKQYAMLVMLEDITHRREANEQLKLAASVFHHARKASC
ncbi:PAS domain S-box protein [Paludibacterium denitrificans]|uniref:PAS domain S-box protein n=1 Tax=Paludibacterium denitrificans TaxID=2675226 RepID=A0A844GF67_9NEIS|nr:PAS domain S-box protein [Paludibacterium denitrificans]MTD33537.1 PAS domain S-box protein [Paludibacterium denitrificans]